MRIGILGFGGMGYYHATNVKVPGVTFVSTCDVVASAVEDAPGVVEKIFLNDEEAFFADPDINTVLLTVPNHLHKKYAIKAAQSGKNIICEKPAALNPQEFDEMVAAAKQHNVLFTVHQNRRWDKDFCQVKRIYEEGLIGDIFNIESNLHMPSGRVHNWHQFKEYGGGMVYDWAVHCIDQMLFMIDDKLESVYADLKSVFHAEVDDYYKIILKFRGGQTAVLNQSTFVLKPYPRWLVCGDQGTAWVENFAGEGNLHKSSHVLKKLPPRIVPSSAGPTRSFIPVPVGEMIVEDLPTVDVSWMDFYKNYLAVMNGEAEFVIKPAQVRRVLEVMMAVFESAKTKQSIRFGYDD